jgi:alpha-1,2-mannosyltransferase
VQGRKELDGATVLAAACYAGSAAVCCVLASSGHAPFGDLRIYRSGGAAVGSGAPLYQLRFAWNLGFTYPPFAALAFTLLAAVPWAAVPPLVTGISVALLPLTLWLALRLPRGPGVPPLGSRRAARLALAAAAAAVWLEPVRTNLAYGQINLVLTALILYDLSRDDSARLKGAAIGLAAGLKLTPAIFAVYLAATRRYRAAAVAASAFCVTVAAGFAADPADSAAFWAGTFADPMRVGRIENAANQSLRGALARMLHTTSVTPLWLGAALTVGLAGMGVAVVAARRGDEGAGFSLCAVTALLVSPISWSHHWVLAVPALLLAAHSAWRGRTRLAIAARIAAAAAAAIGWSGIIWQVPIGQGRHAELHLDARQLAYADAYVLAGLAVLAVAVAAAVRKPARVKERPHGRGDTDSDVVTAAHDLHGADAVVGEPP